MQELLFMLFLILSVCYPQNHGFTMDVVVGEEVVIPCGVQVNGQRTSLIWKFGQDKESLAFSYDGAASCDITKKDCSLQADGSLVLRNVQETDSDDYYCEVDGETYFSQHSLIVHPEVAPPAFEICPKPEDVFVTQTSPEEIVLAYTSPSCSNTDVVGNVTCDPSSGVKIEMSSTEIVCSCIYSGKPVDTCEIDIPDVTPTFENCPSSVSVSKSEQSSLSLLAYTKPTCRNAKGLIGEVTCDPASGTETDESKIDCTCIHSGRTVDTCEMQITAAGNASGYSAVTVPGILIGMFIGMCIGMVVALCIARAFFVMKYKPEQSNDNQGKTTNLGPVSQPVDENVGNPNCRQELLPLNAGNPVDTTDADLQGGKCDQPLFGGMKEFVVNGATPKFRILPSVDKPSCGIEIKCQFRADLCVDLPDREDENIPEIKYERVISGLSASVAEVLTLPMHITCGKCKESCCTFEIYGDKWIEMDAKAKRKMKSFEDDQI